MNSKAGSSTGHRVQRVERELQNTLGRHFLTGLKEPLKGLVTVAEVQVSRDLRSAKVYVSQMADPDEREYNEECLEDQRKEIQRHVSKTLQMKFCPVIRFFFNDPGAMDASMLADLTPERE